MSSFSLEQHQLTVADVHRNLPPSMLYEHAIRYEHDASIAENGALVAYSGKKTGRSPKDKRIVEAPGVGKGHLVGHRQHPLRGTHLRDQPTAGHRLPQHARAPVLLRRLRRLGSEIPPQGSRHLLAALPRAVHAQHAHPSHAATSWRHSASPTHVIYNAGAFPANRLTSGMTSTTSVSLSFEDRELVILGTEYAGEMKKGVFTVMQLPDAQAGRALDALLGQRGPADRAIVAVLRPSGTGKTTLSADPKRQLIGDDEHCWSDDGVFNIEGGLLRQVHQSHAGERAGDLPGASLRHRAGKRCSGRGPHGRLHQHAHHGEHPRRLSDRVHPQRQDSLHRRTSDQRHLPDLRRVRRAAAGERR